MEGVAKKCVEVRDVVSGDEGADTGASPFIDAVIGADVRLTGMTPDDFARVRQFFEFPNPDYVTAVRLDKSVHGIPSTVMAWSRDGDAICIPRGGFRRIREEFRWRVLPDDRRPRAVRIARPVEVPMRDYQREAVDAFCRTGMGHIVVPCGGGKTRIAMGIIGRLGVRTCVLVHTRDLMLQWEKNLKEMGLDRIAQVRTIQGLLDVPKCDLVVLDEAHHVAAVTFRDLIDTCPAVYRLGLTATPKREDGLTAFLDLYLGPKVYEATHQMLVEKGVLVVPEIRTVFTRFSFPYKTRDGHMDPKEYHAMVEALCNDEERNSLVADTVAGAIEPKDIGIVLSGRVEHAKHLAEILNARGIRAGVLTGGMSDKRRYGTMLDAAEGRISVICATTVADEGLDLPKLSKVFLAFPSRSMPRTIQRLGRIMRPCRDKGNAVLFDFVDLVGPLKAQAQARSRLYAKLLGSCGRVVL
ncbi:MAG: DEAD/DEAH box helicase [Akkermansia sp.]|nr:DEAD/DEAH box helicase [Akkermansia sp.]